jgi:hypothetical protein
MAGLSYSPGEGLSRFNRSHSTDVLISHIHERLVHFYPYPNTCCSISEHSEGIWRVPCLEQEQVDRSRKEHNRSGVHQGFSCKRPHQRIGFHRPEATRIMVEKVIGTLRIPCYRCRGSQTQNEKGDFVARDVSPPSARGGITKAISSRCSILE